MALGRSSLLRRKFADICETSAFRGDRVEKRIFWARRAPFWAAPGRGAVDRGETGGQRAGRGRPDSARAAGEAKQQAYVAVDNTGLAWLSSSCCGGG